MAQRNGLRRCPRCGRESRRFVQPRDVSRGGWLCVVCDADLFGDGSMTGLEKEGLTG